MNYQNQLESQIYEYYKSKDPPSSLQGTSPQDVPLTREDRFYNDKDDGNANENRNTKNNNIEKLAALRNQKLENTRLIWKEGLDWLKENKKYIGRFYLIINYKPNIIII